MEVDKQVCAKCEGKGRIIPIIETRMEAGGKNVLLDSKKGEPELCDACNGSGLID